MSISKDLLGDEKWFRTWSTRSPSLDGYGIDVRGEKYVSRTELAIFRLDPDGSLQSTAIALPQQGSVEWMRVNQYVCLESRDRWLSVIVTDQYEELPETPELDEDVFGAREIDSEVCAVEAA